jgi:hypothetical protein
MSAPQEASYDETSRNSTAHGQASLTLPPIRSLDLSLSRAEEHEGTDTTFHTAQQQAQARSSGDIHVSTPSQPRRDSAYQWRPYAAPHESNPTGQAATGPAREAPLGFGRPYATDTNYPSSFVRDPLASQPTTTQFRSLSGAASHSESTELSTFADGRGGNRRAEPAYSSSAAHSSEHLGPQAQAHTSRSLDRGASMIDARHEFRGPTSGTPQASYDSPAPSNFAPPQNFGSQSPQFPLSRPSFSAPGYQPSSPILTIQQTSSHREDSATNTTTSSSGVPAYSHQSFGEAIPTTSTTTTPFHPRSWPDRNPHSTAAVEISGPSRPPGHPPASETRIGMAERWGPPSPDLPSHSPSRAISAGHGQVPRLRASPPIFVQPHGVAKLSTSISEVCSGLAHPSLRLIRFPFQHFRSRIIAWPSPTSPSTMVSTFIH